MKVRLDEMTWPEVKEFLSQPNAVVIPMGSTEQHGTHLPINFDSANATYTAERAAEKVMKENNIKVLVAPTIDYTDVGIHKMFPGTIGVKPDTLVKVIAEIVESFLEQGFRNIIILNGHRENDCPLELAMRIVNEEHEEANLYAISTIDLGFDVRPGLVKAGLPGMGHALEVETSMALLIEPHLVQLDKAMMGSRRLTLSSRYVGAGGKDKTKGVIYYKGPGGFEKTGTLGDPTKGSKEEGEKICNAVINDFADIIVQVVNLGKK